MKYVKAFSGIFLLLVILVLNYSCKEEEPENKVPNCSILNPPNGIEVIQGRDFSSDRKTDENCILINQKALDVMQLDDPIGEVVYYWGRKATIIGVVENFYIHSLHRPISQLMIINRPGATHMVMVKIKSKRLIKKPVSRKIDFLGHWGKSGKEGPETKRRVL